MTTAPKNKTTTLEHCDACHKKFFYIFTVSIGSDISFLPRNVSMVLMGKQSSSKSVKVFSAQVNTKGKANLSSLTAIAKAHLGKNGEGDICGSSTRVVSG